MVDIARLALMQLSYALIMSPAISPDLDKVLEGYIKDFLMHVPMPDGGSLTDNGRRKAETGEAA